MDLCKSLSETGFTFNFLNIRPMAKINIKSGKILFNQGITNVSLLIKIIVITHPDKNTPLASRIIGLESFLFSSDIGLMGEDFILGKDTKKIIRVLYIAVIIVARRANITLTLFEIFICLASKITSFE